MEEYRVVFITAVDFKEAKKIADFLLKEKLAACINIIKNIFSLFWWDGKINKASEVLLIIKTEKKKVKDIIKETKKLHSYKVPEIITLSIKEGSQDYISWIKNSID